MKILLITDQHFGVRNDNQVFIEKYHEFYSETVLPFIDKNKIEHMNHVLLTHKKGVYKDSRGCPEY